MRRALGEATRSLAIDAAAIELNESGTWPMRYVEGLPVEALGSPMTGEPVIARLVSCSGEALVLDDVTSNETVGLFATRQGIRSLMAVPLVAREETIGVLLLIERRAARHFEPAEVDFASRLGTTIGLALENARLFAESLERERLGAALNEIAASVATLLDYDEILTQVIGQTGAALGAESAAICSLSDNELVPTHLWQLPAESLGVPIPRVRTPYVDVAVASRQVVAVDDCGTDPRVDLKLQHEWQVRSVMAVPLVVRNEVVGAMFFNYHSQPHQFTAPEIDFVGKAATNVSGALDNVRLFEAEAMARRQADHELETTRLLLEAAASMAEPVALPDVLDRLVEVALRASGHSRVTVSSWHEEPRLMEVVRSAGETPLATGFTIALDDMSSAAKAAVAEGKTVLVDYDSLQQGRRGLGDRVTSHAMLHVPMFAQGRVVGFLAADDPGERREFDDREIVLIEGIASHAAVAIENARLFEAQQAELARTKVMKELTAAAASSLEPAQLCERVLSAARELLEAETGSVYLTDDGGRRAHHVAHFGYPPRIAVRIHEAAIDGHTLTGRALLSGEVETAFEAAGVSDYPEQTEQTARTVGLGAHRMIAVPVYVRGVVVGVVALGFRGQRPFSDDEISLYRAVAEQLGVGLDNARLYAEQQRIAQTLQENFIHELPTVAGLELGVVSQTAHEPELVGGDFSDVFVIDDTHVVVLIGDVAGKGVRAAGLTKTVRSTVRALAVTDSSPASILTKANGSSCASTPTSRTLPPFWRCSTRTLAT